MHSPHAEGFAVLSLLALGTFFTLAAAILRWSSSRFHLAIRRDETYDFGDEPLDASPWMPYQRPASESVLQPVDGVVGPSRCVHTPDSDVSPGVSLRGSDAKGAQTL